MTGTSLAIGVVADDFTGATDIASTLVAGGLRTVLTIGPPHAGDAYDWIGFDPRGVGSSKPALSCDPNHFAGPRPLYEPLTPALERTWLARSKAYATACGKNGGALLAHATRTVSRAPVDVLSVVTPPGWQAEQFYLKLGWINCGQLVSHSNERFVRYEMPLQDHVLAG